MIPSHGLCSLIHPRLANSQGIVEDPEKARKFYLHPTHSSRRKGSSGKDKRLDSFSPMHLATNDGEVNQHVTNHAFLPQHQHSERRTSKMQ
jgi:hypothetical protein